MNSVCSSGLGLEWSFWPILQYVELRPRFTVDFWTDRQFVELWTSFTCKNLHRCEAYDEGNLEYEVQLLELWPSFTCKYLHRCEAYDEGNLEHEVQLLELWRLLQPDRQLDKERGSNLLSLLVTVSVSQYFTGF